MTEIKWRFAFVCLAVAALLVPALAASGSPAAAATRTAASTACHNWFVLGLHGMAEGPDPNGRGSSKELNELQSQITQNGPKYAYDVVEKPVGYPTFQLSSLNPETLFKLLDQNLRDGVNDLQAAVQNETTNCPGSIISLFGFSEGAWIINVWEQQYPDEASQIHNAALIGDPCYADIPGDVGLARLFDTGTCPAAVDYEFGPLNIQPTDSECLTGDPVCGVPYLGNLQTQEVAAAACLAVSRYSACAHNMYVRSGDIADLVEWMLTET